MVVTTKYLGGGIIEGASTDSTSSNATLTYTGDMSSGWTQTDSGADFTIDTTNEEVDLLGAYNANNVRWDSSTVATLSTTAWVVRFAYQNTGTASGDNPVWWVGFSTDSTVASNSTAQDFVGFGSQVGNGGTTLRTYLYATDNARLDQATSAQRLQLDSSNVDLVSDNTKYYIEIKRDGNDFTVNAYSDSAYSTLLCAKTYTYSAVGTLRYFIIANYIQGSGVTGTFSEFNWWNGVTAPVTVTAKDKSTITNVPAGTRYEETDTRKIFHRAGGTNVAEWLEKGSAATHNILRGLVGGGGPEASTINTIDYITIASAGNASDFGDLTVARMYAGALADSTRGLWGGGGTDGSTYSNVIDYVIVATAGNATDFGDLSVARRGCAGLADSTRGCWSGGYNSNIGDDAADYANAIDYVTILTTGNASDFGDLTVGRENISSLADLTRGVWAGGHNVNDESNVMDYVTIATTGNATDFGNLLTTNNGCRGVSNNTRGCWMGHGHSVTNVIQYITIQTTGNATDFGDLTVARRSGGAMADLTRGILAGGHVSTDTMDYITIDTLGNATDFGNLTSARINLNGCAA